MPYGQASTGRGEPFDCAPQWPAPQALRSRTRTYVASPLRADSGTTNLLPEWPEAAQTDALNPDEGDLPSHVVQEQWNENRTEQIHPLSRLSARNLADQRPAFRLGERRRVSREGLSASILTGT